MRLRVGVYRIEGSCIDIGNRVDTARWDTGHPARSRRFRRRSCRYTRRLPTAPPPPNAPRGRDRREWVPLASERSRSKSLAPLVPITRAPRIRASCGATTPTPPAAADTTTVSPGCGSTASTAAHAEIRHRRYRRPDSNSTPRVCRTSESRATTTKSACAARGANPMTSSPTANPLVPSPTSATFTGKVIALSFRELCGPLRGEFTLPDTCLTGI